jgi:hypothetical protein
MADNGKARNMAEDNPSDAAKKRWTLRGVGMSYRKAVATDLAAAGATGSTRSIRGGSS